MDGVNCVMRSYFHPFPQNNKGQDKRKFDCGRDAAHMKENCDMCASGNVKGRKCGNTNLRGKVICKWILDMYLIWPARLYITGHISGPLAGSREKGIKQYKAEDLLTN